MRHVRRSATSTIRALIMLVALIVAGVAAAGTDEVREQAQLSMVVKGRVTIETDGSVSGYTLDQPGKLPPVVPEFLGRVTPKWKFEPVTADGKPVRTSVAMSVRLAAKPHENGRDFIIRVASARFGEFPSEWMPTARGLRRTAYPKDAARSRVHGVVYVVVKVGRSGKVDDAIVEQVNLRVVDTAVGMDWWRKSLGDAALASIRRSTFDVPTQGPEVDHPFWSVRIPVDFLIPGKPPVSYGEWEAYVAGPRRDIPWVSDQVAATGADAVGSEGIYPLGSGPKLLTSLNGT